MDWEWFKEDGVWIVVTLAIAAFLLWAMQHWIPRLISWIVNRVTPRGEDWSGAARKARRAIYWVGCIFIVTISVLIILPLVGVEIERVTDELKDWGRGFVDWVTGSGIRVVITFVIAYVVARLIRDIIPRAVHGAVVKSETRRERLVEEAEQRAETLSTFLVGAAIVVIWIVAIFLILPEFDVNIAPLLAGAGVLGIGIGFGAQGLVRDTLAGIFIIIEDQYAKGDWVEVCGIQGEVESLGLRRTVLRDFNGTHHSIPNGSINVASNFSKDWACVNLDIVVGYGEDLERVTNIMNKISQDLIKEEKWRDFVIDAPPKVLYVSYLGDSGISLKIWGKTKPMWQWAVTGELRKRIKEAFDKEGIEIPWPHIKLYFGDNPASVMGMSKKQKEG